MAKKVLVIEQSLAVRGIAESLLRQNGYEAIAADTAAAAAEILKSSKIDLILVSSDITDDNEKPYYEILGIDRSTAVIPLLILHDPASSVEDPAYPPEAIINKPFTPRDLLQAVSAFAGAIRQDETTDNSPFSGADFEDALIDSALGLDKIEVDESEVMDDDSSVFRKKGLAGKTEAMIGFEYKVKSEDTTQTSKKEIEAIHIPSEEQDDVFADLVDQPAKKSEKTLAPKEIKPETEEFMGQPKAPKPVSPKSLSESSKIEIVTDQYGIVTPEEMIDHGTSDSDDSHDYEWFLRELKKESEQSANAPGSAKSEKAPPTPKPEAQKPIAEKAQRPSSAPQTQNGSKRTEAVDAFISEFKKEMEKITGETASNLDVTTIGAEKTDTGKSSLELKWDEGLESISSADIQTIANRLVAVVSRKVADHIIEQLDLNTVYSIIKESIDAALKERLNS